MSPRCPRSRVENRVSPWVATAPRRAAGARVSASPKAQPIEAAPFAQQVARGDVGVGDALLGIDQHQRHRRILHDRIEQQFALHQMRALLAQGSGQLVVRRHQLAELIVAVDDQGDAEIPFPVARHRTGQGAQQLLRSAASPWPPAR